MAQPMRLKDNSGERKKKTKKTIKKNEDTYTTVLTKEKVAIVGSLQLLGPPKLIYDPEHS